MPRDDDELLTDPTLSFGSGVIGVCDVCGHRQAVIVLQKERFKLCVIDFLNKTWLKPGLTPHAPLPPYRSERVWFPTDAVPERKAPAIVLSPTKPVKHPVALLAPDIYGLTTSVLDAGIRLAREGFEVLLPDLGKTAGIGPADHLALRVGARFRGGVPLDGARIVHLRQLYSDALRHLRGRDMVDPLKTAVVGLSYGASLATALATQDRSVGALVLVYPVPVRPPEYLRLVTSPVLFVDAGRDGLSRRARAQFEPLATRGEIDVRFAEFPSSRRHFLARDLSAYDLTSAESAWGQILAFVRERLLPPPPRPPTPPKIAPPAGAPASPTASTAAPAAPPPTVAAPG